MNRTRMLAAAAFAALASSLLTSGAGAAVSGGTLVGSVSDPLRISLLHGGAKVAKLNAGKYTITIRDLASDHNFHLKGPGVDKSTSVSAKGTTTWHVTLKPGKYTYVCDPHASFMKGSFTVS